MARPPQSGSTRLLSLEKLEDRSVPAAVSATLTGNQLFVTGTDGPDRIRISQSTDQARILVQSHGATIASFNAASISEISIDAGLGNDVVGIDPRVSKTVTMSGGEGTDILQGGGGTTMASGDGGVINRVLGASGTNTLVAGSGNDVLAGGNNSNNLVVPGSSTGKARLFGYADKSTITGAPADFSRFLAAMAPPDLGSTLGLQPSPAAQQLSTSDVQDLLNRASAATPSNDAIIAIVDRSGRILGVKV
ncbi:MAG: hypothetical protein ACKON9_27455, partial [Planctomycetaceae bacterium]